MRPGPLSPPLRLFRPPLHRRYWTRVLIKPTSKSGSATFSPPSLSRYHHDHRCDSSPSPALSCSPFLSSIFLSSLPLFVSLHTKQSEMMGVRSERPRQRLDVETRQRVPREMGSDGRRLKLLTSRTANFHMTVLFRLITPPITDMKNVEIHHGGGRNGIKFTWNK